MPTTSPAPLRVELGARSYDVVYAPLRALGEQMRAAGLRAGACVLVTDAHVGPLYAAEAIAALRGAGFEPTLHTVPAGEASKSAEQLAAICSAALEAGIDRATPLVALGGGVVGDLAGFAAATLLRGIPLVHVPTSCIAMVDSALGGKTGINHAVGKNLIGAFHQPRLVHVAIDTLATLPPREWTSGLAEVVKHACIADAALFDRLEATFGAVLQRGDEVTAETVRAAASVKARIVAEDEREHGRRALLNFGHTFGHAIEAVAGYGVFAHGEAVALGMRAALSLSAAQFPELRGSRDLARAEALVARLPVPGGVAGLPLGALMRSMRSDKKVAGGTVRFVVMRRLGEGAVVGGADAPVDERAVRAAWASLGVAV